jgi:hypothetical protein
MRKTTLNKYLKILQEVKESGKTLKEYCNDNTNLYSSVTQTISKIREMNQEESEIVSTILTLYSQVTNTKLTTCNVDTDTPSEISYERDENGKIIYYKYEIFRRDKTPLCGRLTREEMNTIYRLYSFYGDSLTQRIISRYFTEISLIDFKRILRAFNITKASSPFAPHMFEEKTEEELREIQLREKENSFLRKAEEDNIRNNEKLLKKYAQENIELKKKLKEVSEFKISIPSNLKPVMVPDYEPIGQGINLYLSDIHLGASINSGAMYQENIDYGFDEAKRRLTKVLEKLSDFDCLDTVNIVLLGDNIDCPGFFGKTARLDHDMPENMDPREQANKYIELIMWFIESLIDGDREFCSELNVYSVPCGNHAGNFEYICNKALMASINTKFPNVNTTLWEEFYGTFDYKNHIFICTHGKDDQFCKRGLPLNLDDKNKVMLYEWLDSKGITGNNIHFIKGDLHSNSMNSCRKFTYRNVLSLFGASDYSNYNFSRNSYGVSYDLLIGDNVISGTFENM